MYMEEGKVGHRQTDRIVRDLERLVEIERFIRELAGGKEVGHRCMKDGKGDTGRQTDRIVRVGKKKSGCGWTHTQDCQGVGKGKVEYRRER